MIRPRRFPRKLLACAALGAFVAAAGAVTLAGQRAPEGIVRIPSAAPAAPVNEPAASDALPGAGSLASIGFDPAATQCSYPTAKVEYWNVANKFGGGLVTRAALAAAVTAANNWWNDPANDPDTTVVLQIGTGSWNISGGAPAINVNNLNSTRPAAQGWLVFEGAGMNATTLVFGDMTARGFQGANVNRLHICNMHLTRSQETVTQGTVIGFRTGASWSPDPDPAVYGDQTLANPGTPTSTQTRFLVLRIPAGFPDIDSIYNPTFGQGRYIRKYRYSPGGQPYLVQDNNDQTAWQQKDQLANGDWVLGLGAATATYAVGDTIAVKSKKAGEPLWFAGGSSIVVENVRFTRASRLLYRNHLDHLRFSNISIERGPAIGGLVPFLSTSEGGPQIGQPNEGPVIDAVVENSQFFGTGDDAIAAFDATGLKVSNVRIEDSFARGILLDDTTTTSCIRSALIDRSPLTMLNGAFAWGCVTDGTAPAAPAGVSASAAPGIVTLSWTASGAADLDGYAITRTPAGGTSLVIATGVTGTSYQDISAKAGVQYTYTLVAFDTSRNNSTASGGATVTAM